MDVFYLIVLSIAVVLLILILTFIGLLMRNQRKGEIFPPVSNTCPDGWTVATDSNSCIIPTSVPTAFAGITDSNTPGRSADKSAIDFSNSGWTGLGGKSAICAKRNWANTYGVVWDGVSNYNSC